MRHDDAGGGLDSLLAPVACRPSPAAARSWLGPCGVSSLAPCLLAFCLPSQAPRLLLRWWQQQARCLRWARDWMQHKASGLFQLRALAQAWLLWSSHTQVATRSCCASRAPYLSWLGWRNGKTWVLACGGVGDVAASLLAAGWCLSVCPPPHTPATGCSVRSRPSAAPGSPDSHPPRELNDA